MQRGGFRIATFGPSALGALVFFVLMQCGAEAAGRVALVDPIPLQTLKTNSDALKLTGTLVDAINRVPGVDAIVMSNDPNKSTAAAFVLEGSGINATGVVSTTPPPSTDYLNVAANPAGTAVDSVTVFGKSIKITPVGVNMAKPEKNLGAPEYLVRPTLVIDPSNDSNLTLYLFVTQHDGGLTRSCHWQTSAGAADLNKTLAKLDLSALFDARAFTDLGTILVIPQRLEEVAYAPRVQNRLGNAHLSTVVRNDVSLANNRAQLSIACAEAGARTILAWGVETDKEPRPVGSTGYHARVSFDLLNCLPTDYNPDSVATGLYRKRLTNVSGVIASIGAILQTATRMTIAPIANVLSGSTITAIFPPYDDAQITTRAVNAALDENVEKLCTQLGLADWRRDHKDDEAPVAPATPAPTPSPGCAYYQVSHATPAPWSTRPPASPNPSPTASASPGPAFFVIQDGKSGGAAIRMRLENPALITQAIAILADSKTRKHVQVKLLPGAVSYERRWGFHVDPASVSFFDVSDTPSCDVPLDVIAKNVGAIGGTFLPGGVWCSWDSHLIGDAHPGASTGDTYRPAGAPGPPSLTGTHKKRPGKARPNRVRSGRTGTR